MVRLQPEPNAILSLHALNFQSHYGAIATDDVICSTKAALCFQSHYGAIATQYILLVKI